MKVHSFRSKITVKFLGSATRKERNRTPRGPEVPPRPIENLKKKKEKIEERTKQSSETEIEQHGGSSCYRLSNKVQSPNDADFEAKRKKLGRYEG